MRFEEIDFGQTFFKYESLLLLNQREGRTKYDYS